MSADKTVVIGVTGSVATIKIPEIVSSLVTLAFQHGISVKVEVVATPMSLHFIDQDESMGGAKLWTDADEYGTWKQKGDDVLHIQLRKRADVLVIAPMSANTMAKLSSGLCDNLLTCTARAWDFRKPFLVFPAMNTMMWEHPLTEPQLLALQALGVKVFRPVVKELACGDVGVGGLPPPSFVAERIVQALMLGV